MDKVELRKICKTPVKACCGEFERLIIKRNALIHAHPSTDKDGSQILVYLTKVTKTLSDMKWPPAEIEATIREFDQAAGDAVAILDKLR